MSDIEIALEAKKTLRDIFDSIGTDLKFADFAQCISDLEQFRKRTMPSTIFDMERQLTAMTAKYEEAKQDAQDAMDTMDEAVRQTGLANERAEKAEALRSEAELQRDKLGGFTTAYWYHETQKGQEDIKNFRRVNTQQAEEITRLRKACKALLDGLDDCWVTTPKGQQAVMDAQAALSARENTDG